MRYEGIETISFPESISRESVDNRIDRWLNTEIGRRYRIWKTDSEEMVLKRTWMDTWCLAFTFLWSISSLIDFLIIPSLETFGVLVVGFLPLVYLFIFIPSRVIIHAHIQDSTVRLKLESTHKKEAEQDFDSLIHEIE
jgi:hypothetical protein